MFIVDVNLGLYDPMFKTDNTKLHYKLINISNHQ